MDTPRRVCCTFTHQGREYPVSLLTEGLQRSLGQWVKARARRVLVEMREVYSPEEYAQKVAEFEERCLTGHYDHYGPLAQKALATPAGGLAVAAALLSLPEDEAAELLRSCPEAPIAVKQALAESRPRRQGGPEGEGAEGNAVPAA